MKHMKVGDTVRLKSGSPLMTVEGIWDENPFTKIQEVRCCWFRRNGTLAYETFLMAILEVYTVEDVGIRVYTGTTPPPW